MFIKKDLKPLWDDKTVLKNPHKGWYWHYIDNGMKNKKYRDRVPDGEYYTDFPGLNHLYLRFDWSDIQPKEGIFDWSELDRIMDEWGAKGYRFALRACCSETGRELCFATPKWVMENGCKGNFYPPYPDENPEWWELCHNPNKAEDIKHPEDVCHAYWEPDYDDPVFLRYLDIFLEEYAKKYDGDSRIEFVDLGSYGNWGEGHTSCGSMRIGNYKMHKEHILLHMKYFKKTPVLVNDDFINMIEGNSHEAIITDTPLKHEITDYCLSCKMGLRDDSVIAGPDKDLRLYPCLCTPELFDKFYKNAPIDIEVDHYGTYNRSNDKGGLVVIEAARRAHATFMGFHGYIEDYLPENKYVAEYLANRLGYWYFIENITHIDKADKNTKFRIDLTFINQGFGLCYKKYALEIRFSGPKIYTYLAEGFNNLCFDSGEKHTQPLFVNLDADMENGKYDISVRMYEPDGDTILLGFLNNVRDKDGFYSLSSVEIM